ncbi:UNVERIFIED_CONTAM: hypothetical protein GTU68_012152 [Idotea baltica]|nr:hypothetical protein [Idotea baltica]
MEESKSLNVPTIVRLRKKYGASYVIVSTVKHLTKRMLEYIERDPTCFLLSPFMKLPFSISYKTPETLGLDRLAGIAGAWARFPKGNSLVIDAGTCIKYDLITSDGSYLGGNISPGVRMRLEAMHLLTSKLPQVEAPERYERVGTDTASALQVGACTGSAYEMGGFITDYKKMFGKLNILLTGGDSHFFVNHLKTKIFEHPHLVLEGLNEILDYNA